MLQFQRPANRRRFGVRLFERNVRTQTRDDPEIMCGPRFIGRKQRPKRKPDFGAGGKFCLRRKDADNGETAIVLREGQQARVVISISVAATQVNEIRIMGNPDKLAWLNEYWLHGRDIAEDAP